MARRTRAAHEPLTLDRVVGHWAVKALAWALVGLAGFVVTTKLTSIDENSLETKDRLTAIEQRQDENGRETTERLVAIEQRQVASEATTSELVKQVTAARDESRSTTITMQAMSSRQDRQDDDIARAVRRIEELEAERLRRRRDEQAAMEEKWLRGHDKWEAERAEKKKP